MINTIIFSIVMFALAYLLYVLPFFLLYALFTDRIIFNLVSLLPTFLVFTFFRGYLKTNNNSKLLKGFIHYGMGIGFLALIILPIMMIFKIVLGHNGIIAGWLGIGMLVGLVIICVFNANTLAVRRITLKSKRLSCVRRLAFLSDIHVGSNPPAHLRRICQLLAKLEFDDLLIGGDLFDSSDFRFEDIAALGTIDAGIYFVTGNHEGYVKGSEKQLARFHEVNIRVLENEAVDLDGINLIGVSDEQPMAARAEALDTLYRQDIFNIALVHQPSIWDRTRNRVDLMLCGHTHNGQIFPFNLLVRLQFRYVYGLFSQGSSYLYVSSGAGCWGPRMRLGSRNEILLVELLPS